MTVESVTYGENGVRTLEVDCSTCSVVHEIIWPAGVRGIELLCGGTVYVPSWCYGQDSYGNRKVRHRGCGGAVNLEPSDSERIYTLAADRERS